MVDVALFCEDRGHELFSRALVLRVARELEVEIELRVMSSSGGHGRAVTQLKAWQRSIERGLAVGKPDLLVVVIDGNCVTAPVKRREIAAQIVESVVPRWVIGCPDPHVERWCFADAGGFEATVGIPPPADPGKCERGFYKRLLRDTVATAGVPIITDEMELAPDLVANADLYRAGRAQPSLGDFVTELRAALTQTQT